jgi:hypothetical protein
VSEITLLHQRRDWRREGAKDPISKTAAPPPAIRCKARRQLGKAARPFVRRPKFHVPGNITQIALYARSAHWTGTQFPPHRNSPTDGLPMLRRGKATMVVQEVPATGNGSDRRHSRDRAQQVTTPFARNMDRQCKERLRVAWSREKKTPKHNKKRVGSGRQLGHELVAVSSTASGPGTRSCDKPS